ncbi:hypothetical protein ASF21_15610 [Arthrobacter sp. Leaf234]|nr:hypothetical protein ASF21_15610 [Arthrobacter sp. Leaf234]
MPRPTGASAADADQGPLAVASSVKTSAPAARAPGARRLGREWAWRAVLLLFKVRLPAEGRGRKRDRTAEYPEGMISDQVTR